MVKGTSKRLVNDKIMTVLILSVFNTYGLTRRSIPNNDRNPCHWSFFSKLPFLLCVPKTTSVFLFSKKRIEPSRLETYSDS